MTDFAWIIPLDKANALGSGGIALNYIIPNNHVSSNLIELKGKKIWIILRGQQDRCIAVVTPKRIERFSEGYYKDDFLITSDSKRSMRLTQNYDSAKSYELKYTQQFSVGLHPLPGQACMALLSVIKSGIQIKLLNPNVGRSTKIKIRPTANKPESTASTALTQINSNFSLDQIWGSGTGHKLTPFANFALHLMNNEGLNFDLANVSILKEFDPLNYLLSDLQPRKTEVENPQKTPSKTVDLEFTEIDPATIYAREFIFSNRLPFDIEAALNKTEVAEKIHQDMLRDISTYLKKNGLVPYESESVDLMIEHNGKTKIFEIKSANDSNLLAQSARGAFQIACYLDAMSPDYESLQGALILHKIAHAQIESIVSNALSRMGIRHLVYDPSLDWPERVRGLFPE